MNPDRGEDAGQGPYKLPESLLVGERPTWLTVGQPHGVLPLSPGAAPEARELFTGSRLPLSLFYDSLHDGHFLPAFEEGRHVQGSKENQQRMHTHGATHDAWHQKVSFELLHWGQEQHDEDTPFEATQEERHHYRFHKGSEHEDSFYDTGSEPDRARATAEGEVGNGPDQAARDRTQQKPGLETLDEGVLDDLEERDALVPYVRRCRSRRYTAGR